MWEISVKDQSLAFLLSCALGAVLCLCYDVLRSLRSVRTFGNIAVFFQDILFSVFAAFITFCFLLAVTAGMLRGYVFVGITIGAVFTRLTISHLFFAFLSYLFRMFLRGYTAAKTAFRSFYNLICGFFLRIFVFFAKALKKILFLLKKGLKHRGKVVYTNTEVSLKE